MGESEGKSTDGRRMLQVKSRYVCSISVMPVRRRSVRAEKKQRNFGFKRKQHKGEEKDPML